jgi:phosphatidate cytidylyltransferase
MVSQELLLRVASAAILAPFALIIAWADPSVFAAVVAAAAVILAWEWTRMSDPNAGDISFGLAVIGAAGGVIISSAGHLLEALGFTLIFAVVNAMEARRRSVALTAAIGVLYIGVPGILIVALRLVGDPAGSIMITALFVTVWGADIGAYLGGRFLGWGRLPTSISEQKTWSGLIAGSALGTMFALMVLPRLLEGMSLVVIAAMALSVAIAGLLGDLLESRLKRIFGVKDSGTLIPGHGGLLDRIDSLLLAAPVFFLVCYVPLAGLISNP